MILRNAEFYNRRVRGGRVSIGVLLIVGGARDERFVQLWAQVIPSLVGMHEHLFHQIERPSMTATVAPAQAAFAKLYLLWTWAEDHLSIIHRGGYDKQTGNVGDSIWESESTPG